MRQSLGRAERAGITLLMASTFMSGRLSHHENGKPLCFVDSNVEGAGCCSKGSFGVLGTVAMGFNCESEGPQ